MKEHYVNMHMNIYKSLPCSECKETFKNYNALSDHKRQNHGAELLKCDQCDDDTFASYSALTSHKQAQHTKKRYICQKCEKPFIRQKYLDTHFKQDHSLTGEGNLFQNNPLITSIF